MTFQLDFAFDNCSGRTIRYKVTGVPFIAADTDPVDAALVEIAPMAGNAGSPGPLAVSSGDVFNLDRLFVVGHPGKLSMVPEDIRLVFGDPDERKRVSFGMLMDQVAADRSTWSMTLPPSAGFPAARCMASTPPRDRRAALLGRRRPRQPRDRVRRIEGPCDAWPASAAGSGMKLTPQEISRVAQTSHSSMCRSTSCVPAPSCCWMTTRSTGFANSPLRKRRAARNGDPRASRTDQRDGVEGGRPFARPSCRSRRLRTGVPRGAARHLWRCRGTHAGTRRPVLCCVTIS